MTLVGAFQSPHLPLLPGLRAYQQSERSGEPPANPAEAVFAMLAKVHPRACDILDALGQQLLDLKPDVLVMLVPVNPGDPPGMEVVAVTGVPVSPVVDRELVLAKYVLVVTVPLVTPV